MRTSSDFFQLINVLYSSNDHKFHKDLREIRILSLGSKLAELPDFFLDTLFELSNVEKTTFWSAFVSRVTRFSLNTSIRKLNNHCVLDLFHTISFHGEFID